MLFSIDAVSAEWRVPHKGGYSFIKTSQVKLYMKNYPTRERGFRVSQCMKGGERAAVTQFMGKIDVKMWASAQLSSDEGRSNYVGTSGCQSKRLGVHQDHGGRLSG